MGLLFAFLPVLASNGFGCTAARHRRETRLTLDGLGECGRDFLINAKRTWCRHSHQSLSSRNANLRLIQQLGKLKRPHRRILLRIFAQTH